MFFLGELDFEVRDLLQELDQLCSRGEVRIPLEEVSVDLSEVVVQLPLLEHDLLVVGDPSLHLVTVDERVHLLFREENGLELGWKPPVEVHLLVVQLHPILVFRDTLVHKLSRKNLVFLLRKQFLRFVNRVIAF